MPSRHLAVFLVLAGLSGVACAGISQRLANPSRQGAPAAVAGRADDPPPVQSGAVGVAERFERSAAAPARVTWQTLTTAHFVLHTDAIARDTSVLLARLERVRASLARWFAADPVAMEIILFDSETDYLRRFGGGIAMHVEMSAGREVLITHRHHKVPNLDEVLDQALVRRFLYAKFGQLPAWLADGVVTHFGAAKLYQDKLLLGRPPSALWLEKEVGAIATLEELLATDAPDVEPLPTRILRTSAWALVGYLLDPSVWGDNAAARLQAWLALAGRPGTTAKTLSDAFADVYPERSLAEVSAAFRGHALSAAGTHRYQHSIVAPETGEPAVTAIPLPLERIEPVLRKAHEELALPRRPDPRQTEALAAWRENKPRHQVRVVGDWAEPTATYGLAYGYSFLRDHSVDLELGKTPLGLFIAPRYRADFEVENARTLLLNLAVGPQLALKNKLLGLTERLAIDDRSAEGTSSFHHLALSGEVAVGAFIWQGFHVRASTTLLLKLATNLDGFCKDPRFRNDPSCPAMTSQAQDSVTGFVRLGAGYAW